MEEIDVPEPETTDAGRVVVAIELAFDALVNGAARLGLPLNPVMGLMYMPDPAITQEFQRACRAVLESLRP